MIRLAEYKDFLEISSLQKEVHKIHVNAEPTYYKDLEVVMTEEYFKSEVDKNHIFVYELNEKILALTIFAERIIANNPIMKDQKILLIDDICVASSERRKGLGRELFNYIENYAYKNNFTKIDLNVWSFNTSAYYFYKSLGMRDATIRMTKDIK